jgi:hypothetical protein
MSEADFYVTSPRVIILCSRKRSYTTVSALCFHLSLQDVVHSRLSLVVNSLGALGLLLPYFGKLYIRHIRHITDLNLGYSTKRNTAT